MQSHLSQAGNSTRSLLRASCQLGKRCGKTQHRHTTGERACHTNPGFPLLSLPSSEFSTDPLYFQFEQGGLQPSTYVNSHDGIGSATEFEEAVSGSGESTENNLPEPSGRSRTSGDADDRKQMSQDLSAEYRPQSSSHARANLTSLKDSANRHAPVFKLIEDTNDTQQEVQDILAKANQQSSSKRTRTSSNSPSRKTVTWEHTFVLQTEFKDAASQPSPEYASQKLGRRRGPLGDDSKERAKEMRRIRSCLRCRISKIRASCMIQLKELRC